ncbi:unnamed protein product [Microthlaspi erraticum]|uniref:CCHC-type domain-containing protein n=1 Tax=Microthlaspi erraticum TaxID=1685480 RepID=A0A6D2IKN9_9BRAS|nr:unnamed protein product [Microthlaspi erraticum]
MSEQEILEETPAARKKRLKDEEAWLERDDKALNLIFMYVNDLVLRKLDKCTTAAKAWETLDRLYLAKTLPNRVHSQLKVYSFKMHDSKSIDQNVDDFTRLVADLGNLSIEIPEEVQAILLLNSLPSRYDQLKETLKYSREGIKMEEVDSAARSKESEFRDMPSSRSNDGEGHYVRGREETRSFKPGKGKQNHKSRSKSRDGKRVCWICGKEGHFKKQCYKWLERNKGKSFSQDNGEASLARDDAKDLLGLVAQEVNLSQGISNGDE